MSLESYQARGICVDSAGDSSLSPPTKPDDVQFVHKGFKDVTVIKSYTSYGHDEETGPTSEYLPPAPKKKERTLRNFDKYSVIVRRIFKRRGNRDMLAGTELCIQSPALCKLFRTIVIDTHEGFDISSTPIVMPAPFYELFYCRKELEEFIQNETQNAVHADVKLLYEFFRNDRLTIHNMATYDLMVGQGRINVETLWTLYPPNTRLFLNVGGVITCWLCRDIQRSPQNLNFWVITGNQLGFDGRELGLVSRRFTISFAGKVDGLMEISELALVPEKYFYRSEQTKKRILERSKIFQTTMKSNLSGYAYRHYVGKVWASDEVQAPVTGMWDERVVVDYHQFVKSHPESAHFLEKLATSRSQQTDYDSDLSSDAGSDTDSNSSSDETSISTNTEEVERDAFELLLGKIPEKRGIKTLEDLLLLSSPLMPVYGLKSKRWAWALIDNLTDVEKNGTPFQSLKIDEGVKSLVQSLVTGHQNGGMETDFDDVVKDKGKGLVIMLHGNPGIGKTLTAESIAELTASPLYSVSGGELNVDVSTVEKTVTTVFEIGKRWNAIILLDEADVVMSKRSSSELERNAIVAVWLRKLEYFEGILFLTTNRKNQLDAAFQSRIHLTINLPDLTSKERQEIWKSLLTLNSGVTDMSNWTPRMYQVLGALNINGRLIKNLLRTATYHARSAGPGTRMQPKHLYDVIKVELSEEPGIKEVLRDLEALIVQPVLSDKQEGDTN
ncbi:hypothetical protein ACHAPI_001197 [Fusarium lateritium]